MTMGTKFLLESFMALTLDSTDCPAMCISQVSVYTYKKEQTLD